MQYWLLGNRDESHDVLWGNFTSKYLYDESIWRKMCIDELYILISTSNIRRKKIRLASMGSDT
jgi:hypothetical protein